MEKIKKVYSLFFYKLYCLFKSQSEDGWEDWKALVVIGGLQGLLIIEFYTWCDIIFKNNNIEFSSPRIVIALIAIIITAFNYYVLLYQDRWRQYEEEFKQYSDEKNKAINLLVFFFILLDLGSLIFAYYQMSLIDWSKYR